jgi:hypothetical protein
MGHTPVYIDPYTNDYNQPKDPAVFLMAHSPEVTYEYTGDLTKTSFELYCKIPKGSIVVDPWRKFIDSECLVVHYGNTRK